MEIENRPKHIAIIMDGNRRWAKQRMLPVKLGHKKGAETLKNIIKYANSIGIEYVTVYAFSTENWKRSKEEVDALMQLLKNYLDDYSKKAKEENIRIKVIGDMTALSEELQLSIKNAIDLTKDNTGTTFIVALNYGGRNEITNAVKKIAEKVKNGELEIENITEKTVAENLYTKDEFIKIVESTTKELIELTNLKPNNIRIRDISYAWGSCSTNKNITISLKLIKYSKKAIKYVILHELCHLKYMNHSKNFWNLVEKYMPDYKEIKKEFK